MFSANANNPEGFQKTYQFDLGHYYKIWFSDTPHEFLGMENQIRFVRQRQRNQKTATRVIQYYFIYSSACLNAEALNAMEAFCIQYKITPIDFDTDIFPLLTDQEDKELYAIAKEEIARVRSNQYGNMAAASDCVRLLVPVIEKCGIYSDYDVTVDLAQLKADVISLRGPLLLHIEMICDKHATMISPNSDFIVFSSVDGNNRKLSKESLIAARNIQHEILKKYKAPFTIDTVMANTADVKESELYALLKSVFADFIHCYPSQQTVYQFRQYVTTMQQITGLKTPLAKDDLEIFKEFLYRLSVINVSGPGVYSAMYKQLFPKNVDQMPSFIPNNKAWNPYLDIIRKSSVGFYDPIADVVTSRNSIIEQQKLQAKIGVLCDQSWTPAGKNLKKLREAKMDSSALKLQGFFKQITHPDAVLLRKAKKICKADFYLLIKQRKYSLLLRKACNEINLPLIGLLLKYRDKINIQINECSSNGNSALDWINQAKGHPLILQKAVQLLTDAGAKSGEAIRLLAPKK
jgi:hypothetical protein